MADAVRDPVRQRPERKGVVVGRAGPEHHARPVRRNDADEEYGDERVVSALRRHRELSAQPMLTAMLNEVKQFSPHEQQDDITLIVAKCT